MGRNGQNEAVKRNYQIEMEKEIASIAKEAGKVPTLLLHSCCAPCSSHCMEVLCRFFHVTVFYYNPNISFEEEYKYRLAEEKRLISIYNEEIRKGVREGYPIQMMDGAFEPDLFFEMAKGYETCPEGGERCFRCYEQRLKKTLDTALKGGFDIFTTTLTISPLKNAQKLNEIGERLAREAIADRAGMGEGTVMWLPSDFKKKNGYKRSTELSAQYGLYRQDYCGCVYSKMESEARKAK